VLINNRIAGDPRNQPVGIVDASLMLVWGRIYFWAAEIREMWRGGFARQTGARFRTGLNVEGGRDSCKVSSDTSNRTHLRDLRRKRSYALGITSSLFAVSCCAPSLFAKQVNTTDTMVRGTVFVRDSTGNQSVVAGAAVKLDGATTFRTETDSNGNYVTSVPRGTYALEVRYPGLQAVATVEVEGPEVRASLELKPAEVTTSVVVTSDQTEPKNPAPSETISEKTLQSAPNVNERFESSLPLIPNHSISETITILAAALVSSKDRAVSRENRRSAGASH
jgi:hypothetical protein